MFYRFEDYSLDVNRQELLRGAELVEVEPGVLDLLQYLIRNRERVASKDDLIARVWNGRIVSESTLSSRIAAVRQAIGDDGDRQRLIRTIARKGFRFVGEVREEAEASSGSPTPVAMPELPDKPSVAILPFANMSGDPEQEYFTDGISEDIITELSRFSELFVIARNSSFQYKGKSLDVRQIARELGVRYLLEGSIRRAGERVRISAQLVDAQTGAHRWAERYDRGIADIFAVQDEVARTVAALLVAHVSKAEAERTALKPPATWQAYDYYMRAADAYAGFQRSVQREALYEVHGFLQQCLAIDPGFARAYALQSTTHISSWAHPLDDDYLKPAVLEAARMSAEKAVQLEPTLPQAHTQLAQALSFQGHHDVAVAELERAMALNRNFTDWRLALILIHAGQSERAIEVANAHLRVDPFALPIARGVLGFAYYLLRRHAEAVATLNEFVSQSPNHRPGRAWLTAAYAQLGKLDEARSHAQELLRIDPDWALGRVFRKDGYLRDEDVDHLTDGLRKAGLPE